MRRTPLVLTILALASAAVAACSGGPTGSQAMCARGSIYFGGTYFTLTEPASASDAGPLFGTARRDVDCVDLIVNGTPSSRPAPQDGDAAGVAPGTPFYTRAGAAAGTRLVARLQSGEWVSFEPAHTAR